MKKIKSVILALSALSLFSLPLAAVAFAQTCAADEVATDLGCVPQDPVPFVEKFYGYGLGLIGFVALLFMIIGGYNIMMSRGNFEQLERGKSFIYYSIAGIIMAVLGFVFIQVVTGQILKIPGFN
ncbi:MAG TPA: hypothetical protein VHE53_04565 [Patescibacteria group bacterium]|nr:hypothetical protein [Patescibacteria group bacterium]